MHKRRKIAYKEDQIGLMYLAMKGRKRCASCKRWTLLTAERCSACDGSEFDMQREAPKQKQKLLRSRFYRNYLMFRLGSLHGFRRGEMTGQRPEDAICRCVRCRAYRLHQKGKTLEQIADHIRRGLK